MFIPYGDFPPDFKLNSIEIFPKLFKKIDFADFARNMKWRFSDFSASELFFATSPYQHNDMTSLVMLLSAVERAVAADHKPLDWQLQSKEFRGKMESANSGKDAFKVLTNTISLNTKKYGSSNAIVKFYCDNLTNKEKLSIIYGIRIAHKYKPKKVASGMLYIPVNEPNPVLDADDTDKINEELTKRIKALIYTIRNGFVHRAQSNPFGNKEYLEKNFVYQHEIFKNGAPKEGWLITMSFEKLHELTRAAFQRFWEKDYKNIIKGSSGSSS